MQKFYSYNNTNEMHQFLKFILRIEIYTFQRVSLPIIRSLALYTQQRYMSYSFADSLRAGSGCKTVWHIPLLCVQWRTHDDRQSDCPKYVEFHSKNKFEKSAHLIGFIIRIFHDARSHKRQIWNAKIATVTYPRTLNNLTILNSLNYNYL
jgi:hypothetical protein